MRFGFEYKKKGWREFLTLKIVMFCAGCKIQSTEDKLYYYVDGNNKAITKNSPPLCKECYVRRYRK